MPDRVDEAFARGSSREKRAIPDPPVLGSEFEDDLLAVRVRHIAAQAAFSDKCRMTYRLASALQELTGAKRRWNEEPFQEIELCRCERCLALEVPRSGLNRDIACRRPGRNLGQRQVYAAGLQPATKRAANKGMTGC